MKHLRAVTEPNEKTSVKDIPAKAPASPQKNESLWRRAGGGLEGEKPFLRKVLPPPRALAQPFPSKHRHRAAGHEDMVGGLIPFDVELTAKRTLRSVLPINTAATTDAHAPVPQARVSPAPRSQTRIFK